MPAGGRCHRRSGGHSIAGVCPPSVARPLTSVELDGDLTGRSVLLRTLPMRGTMGTRVFISSTCHDLIDMRAEVSALIGEAGLTPVMSDRPSSEFSVLPDANSIESCLANVRASDFFVIILSQRYGPSLAKCGYPDLSATHLEYKEAKEAKKPVLMYVRDRLEADFCLWRNSNHRSDSLAWVKPADAGIFTLLEEHRSLAAGATTTNWYWLFRDSMELKERLRKDLAIPAGQAMLRSLMARGQIALVMPVGSENSGT